MLKDRKDDEVERRREGKEVEIWRDRMKRGNRME